MKREYVKPFLAVESFQLDAAIAASCSPQGNIGLSIDTCMHQDLGFFGSKLPCVVDVTDDQDDFGDDALCYQGPDVGLSDEFLAS